jgi:hypothetical protein
VVVWGKMWKAVLAFVLAVVSVQCAAACTPAASCPHHKQAPSCSHELVPATIVQSSAVGVIFISDAIDTASAPSLPICFQPPTLIDPSPPGSAVFRRLILRI